jgi:hypothetical protein
MSEFNVEIREITPANAAALLLLNTNNRSVRKRHVARLASAMRAGHWQLNGETLKFNGEQLLDGQHRLLACIEANTPFITLVASGISSEAMPSIDKGTSRRTGDSLRWLGFENGNDRAAMLKPLWALENGINLRSTQSYRNLNDFELIKIHERLIPHIDLAVPLASRMNHRVGLGRRSWGVAICWMLMSGADQDLVIDFMNRVANGDELKQEDPRFQLREWCQRVRGVTGPKRDLRTDEHLIAVIKSWNLWVNGKTAKLLKVNPTEVLPKVAVS